MAVYLGNTGIIEIRRDTGALALAGVLDPEDVASEKDRFSVDGIETAVITGDQIDITCTTGDNLEFIDGHAYPDWRGYCHVDGAGGVRLYDSFSEALAGEQASALNLVSPSTSKQLEFHTRASRFNCLARITDYTITTNRDQVDQTVLGDQFRSYLEAGLISGQGKINCLWEHKLAVCDPTSPNIGSEFPVYLSQICIRLEQGSDFAGRFYIYADTTNQTNSVWYEAQCMVTNVAIEVPADGVISTQIEFIATGPFTLRNGLVPSLLLQENQLDAILQEDGSFITIAE